MISVGLLSDPTCVLEAEPCKFDIKRHEPGILCISLQATSDYNVIIDFCVGSMSLRTSFGKSNVMIT